MGAMRLVIVISSIGLTAVVSAALYVYSGASHGMDWTYQDCVTWVTENCSSPATFHAVHCHNIAMTCSRFEPKLQQWVYNWLIETAAFAAFVLGLMPLTFKTVVTRPR